MNRIKIILSTNRTLHEMLIGVAFCNVVLLCIGLVFCKDKGSAVIGLICGMLTACFYTIHMAITIDDAFDLDAKGAMAQMRKQMMIRYVVVCVVVALVSYFEIGNPILCIFAILTTKLGAYLQPVVHKILFRSDEAGITAETDGSENGGRISE